MQQVTQQTKGIDLNGFRAVHAPLEPLELCIGEYVEHCIFMETEITEVMKMLDVNRMKLIDNVLVNNNCK